MRPSDTVLASLLVLGAIIVVALVVGPLFAHLAASLSSALAVVP